MTKKQIATSIGRTQSPDSITFEAVDSVIERYTEDWSEPVRFKFEQKEDGRWELWMQWPA